MGGVDGGSTTGPERFFNPLRLPAMTVLESSRMCEFRLAILYRSLD